MDSANWVLNPSRVKGVAVAVGLTGTNVGVGGTAVDVAVGVAESSEGPVTSGGDVNTSVGGGVAG